MPVYIQAKFAKFLKTLIFNALKTNNPFIVKMAYFIGKNGLFIESGLVGGKKSCYLWSTNGWNTHIQKE